VPRWALGLLHAIGNAFREFGFTQGTAAIIASMRAISSGLIGMCFLTLPSVAQVGSASLTGDVKDITGAEVSNAQVELRSETVSDRTFQTSTDSTGKYHFSGLPKDEYALKLVRPGFKWLTVKSIHVLESEQKLLPTLQLQLGSMADCGGHAVLDYVRLQPTEDHVGNLVGSIRIEQSPFVEKSPPITGADVTLICRSGVCGSTKTDADGVFMFKTQPAGNLSLRVNRTGFYPLVEPGYMIEEGLESVYLSIYLERCPRGNCDPTSRPKRPLAICE
jgi:hypothetical protein